MNTFSAESSNFNNENKNNNKNKNNNSIESLKSISDINEVLIKDPVINIGETKNYYLKN